MGSLRVTGLGKAYRRYPGRWARLTEWLLPGARPRHRLDWVLRDIDFEIAAGEAVGIVGANGAGKSTLLKMLAGTVQPTTGSMQLTGRVAALLELGMGFHPDFTGRQNIVMAGQLLGLDLANIAALTPEIEAFAEIGDYIDQPVRVYSSGMAVRLAFSVATAVRPDILIVDEALSVGDTYFQHKSFERIRRFRRAGTTLLIVSHDRGAIQSICDRAILLDGGRLRLQDTPEVVMDYYNALIATRENATVSQTVLPDGRTRTISGTGEATLDSVTLLDAADQPVTTLAVGAPACLRVVARIHADLPRLVLGYLIKDRLGQAIHGTNTHHLDSALIQLRAGETIAWHIDFAANLGPGNYSVAIALTGSDTHLAGNYEWRDLALLFKVINPAKPVFEGCAWLAPRVRAERRVPPPPAAEPIPHAGAVARQIATRWAGIDAAERDRPAPQTCICPLCGREDSPERFPLHVSRCIFGGGELLRRQCPACDLIFGPEKMLRLSDAALAAEYEEHYRVYAEGDSTAQEIRAFHALRPTRTGLYLNWGAGAWSRGVAELRQDGWNVYGYEPHGAAHDGGAHMLARREQLAALRFDGIFSNNVLEHLRHPVRELAAMRELLLPGGKMSHATPCFEYRFEFTRFHLFFFLGRSRELLAAQAGLRIESYTTDGDFMNLVLAGQAT